MPSSKFAVASSPLLSQAAISPAPTSTGSGVDVGVVVLVKVGGAASVCVFVVIGVGVRGVGAGMHPTSMRLISMMCNNFMEILIVTNQPYEMFGIGPSTFLYH